ncbi:MAG: tetratricopeptide repeat protein [Propionibacteriaceae bacterium]|jgi:tetratricopeptide (TPR) repeat protein|nr:tetratricopeptide repeat protein [Propionibacteriaceae bacterium]
MARISRYTPWLTPRPQLEAMFVAREPMLDDLVGRIKQAAASESRNHTLIVGPRGAGKTHLVALAYYRARDLAEAGAKLQPARLPEDPWKIGSYQDLLQAVAQAIGADSSGDADTLEHRLAQAAAAGGPIVVFLENLDEVFRQLGADGQKKLRSFLQTTQALLLIATTPALDRSITVQSSPFYGYFSTLTLAPFTVDQAREMLLRLARARGDERLEQALGTELARRRLEAIKHLAGSQPRLWATFSEPLAPESFNRMADLLFETFDDLTPYYQDRLRSLKGRQRRVIAELSSVNRPLHVQDLAGRLGLPEKPVASRIAELKDLGWVTKVTTPWDDLLDGRRSYYELAEPLAALAFQMKDAWGEPIKLIIDFLCVWYDPDDLAGTRPSDSGPYMLEAASAFDGDQTLSVARRLSRLPDCRVDDVALLGQVDDALAALEDGDAEPIMALPASVRAALAIRCENESIEALRLEIHGDVQEEMGWVPREPESSQWVERARRLSTTSGTQETHRNLIRWLARSGQTDEALALADANPEPSSLIAIAEGRVQAGRYSDAVQVLERAVAEAARVVGENHPHTLTSRNNLADAYQSAGRLDEAIPLFEAVVADSVRVLGEDHPDTLTSRNNLAGAYRSAGRLDEAIPLYEETLAARERVLGPDHPDTVATRDRLRALVA